MAGGAADRVGEAAHRVVAAHEVGGTTSVMGSAELCRAALGVGARPPAGVANATAASSPHVAAPSRGLTTLAAMSPLRIAAVRPPNLHQDRCEGVAAGADLKIDRRKLLRNMLWVIRN